MMFIRWAVGVALIAGMTAGGAARPGRSDQEHPVTVTGKVVDAACYMLHPPAATIARAKNWNFPCAASLRSQSPA